MPKETLNFFMASVGLISGLFSILLNHILSRRMTEHQHKYDLAASRMAKYLEGYLDLRVQGKEKELQAFQDILFKVQLFRDKLRWVIHSPQSHGTITLSRELRTLVAGIAESYALQQLYLTECDRLAAHDIKTECQHITEQIEMHF